MKAKQAKKAPAKKAPAKKAPAKKAPAKKAPAKSQAVELTQHERYETDVEKKRVGTPEQICQRIAKFISDGELSLCNIGRESFYYEHSPMKKVELAKWATGAGIDVKALSNAAPLKRLFAHTPSGKRFMGKPARTATLDVATFEKLNRNSAIAIEKVSGHLFGKLDKESGTEAQRKDEAMKQTLALIAAEKNPRAFAATLKRKCKAAFVAKKSAPPAPATPAENFQAAQDAAANVKEALEKLAAKDLSPAQWLSLKTSLLFSFNYASTRHELASKGSEGATSTTAAQGRKVG